MAIRDQQKIRLSAIAGTFYEGDALILRRQLAEAESKLPPPPTDTQPIKAVLLPHAGYVFSMPVAMAALIRAKKQKVSRVIILGPSHYVGFHGVITPGFSTWRTPFGDLSTASGAAEQLESSHSPLIQQNDAAHLKEHSLEVQFPLIQYFWSSPEVLPLLIGGLSMPDVRTLAPLMAELDSPETLWIVSSDFTHYGERFQYVPFRDEISENLRKLDGRAAELIANRDLENFARFLGETGATICGMNPIALLLGILDVFDPERNRKGIIAASANSGELTGDYRNAVGYESICFP